MNSFGGTCAEIESERIFFRRTLMRIAEHPCLFKNIIMKDKKKKKEYEYIMKEFYNWGTKNCECPTCLARMSLEKNI